MICKFCGREFQDGLNECPYCHWVVEVDAKTLTEDERDTFSGVTIEQDGSLHEGPRPEAQDSTFDEDSEQETSGEETSEHPGMHIFRIGSSIFWLGLILLFILGLVLTFLPAFIVVAAIISLALFVGRLFFS
jgi:hypothetical protein